MSIAVSEALKSFTKPALIAVVGVVAFFGGWAVNSAFYSDATPEQPINFSHKIHAGDNAVPCLHCHVYADKSPSAGVPPVSKCMNCHKAIATDRPEIIKLTEYWETKQPIPWIKVHDVPDFVHFTHKRHVQAGVPCQHCHGPVEAMDKITQVSSLKMPWCVDCHTERQVENGRDCLTCHK
ncbi:MAG: cytochrome c family protein [Gammaproteobacteria bacterium]|nr:cytochrome c family protein [Gammaproteobacteria bacterium]